MAVSSSWQGRWLVYSRCGWPVHVCVYCGAHPACESHLGTHANGANSALRGDPSTKLAAQAYSWEFFLPPKEGPAILRLCVWRS